MPPLPEEDRHAGHGFIRENPLGQDPGVSAGRAKLGVASYPIGNALDLALQPLTSRRSQ
jgi:hypothetical protein